MPNDTYNPMAGGCGAIIIIDVICPFPYPIRVTVVPKPMWKR